MQTAKKYRKQLVPVPTSNSAIVSMITRRTNFQTCRTIQITRSHDPMVFQLELKKLNLILGSEIDWEWYFCIRVIHLDSLLKSSRFVF